MSTEKIDEIVNYVIENMKKQPDKVFQFQKLKGKHGLTDFGKMIWETLYPDVKSELSAENKIKKPLIDEIKSKVKDEIGKDESLKELYTLNFLTKSERRKAKRLQKKEEEPKDEESIDENPTKNKRSKSLGIIKYKKTLADSIIDSTKELNESPIKEISLAPTVDEEESITKPTMKIIKEIPSKIIASTPEAAKKMASVVHKMATKIKTQKLPSREELQEILYENNLYNKPDGEIIDFINKAYPKDEQIIILKDAPLDSFIKSFKEKALQRNLEKLNKYANLSSEQIQEMKQQGIIDDDIEQKITEAKNYVYRTNQRKNLINDYIRSPHYNMINKSKIISLLNNGFNPALLKFP